MNDPKELKKCPCGYDRTHHAVVPEPTYGFWAWVLLLNGATGTPKKLVFRCQRCREVVETTRDPALLEEYRGRA